MSLLEQAPRFEAAAAVQLAREQYGLDARAAALPSERDQNFQIDCGSARFVLKISNASESRAMLEAQNAAMRHVQHHVDFCPRIVAAQDGREIVQLDGHMARLVTWLPGAPLGTVPFHSVHLLRDLGRRLGMLDRALASFDRTVLHRDFHWDLAKACDVARLGAPRVADRGLGSLVERLVERIGARIEPVVPRLRRSIVHNDPNDFNVLVVNGGGPEPGPARVSGVIDFGDMVATWTISDLAIAIAYAVLDKPDPLAVAAELVSGYAAELPLSAAELTVVFDLAILRLCASVAIAADQRRQRPDDEYLGISQRPIARTLPVLAEIEPQRAADSCARAARGTASARSAEIVRARRAHIGASVRLGYREPVHLTRGSMQYLYDADGFRYLDAYNNVPHVGHSHPRVVEAVAEQLRALNTNTRYLDEGLAAFAERLVSTLPAPLRVCYFVNSGSEANELALRLARTHTGRRGVIVLDAAYHGNTTTLIDISPYKFDGPGGQGRPPWVSVVPLPDVYRGEFRAGDPDAGRRYAGFVANAVASAQGDAAPAAFIAETCPSVGGQIVLPPGYLQHAYAAVRNGGGVCIADEVQTAYGRMGTSFYAFEDQQVVPDIVVLGKPIGNGYPMGAVVTTPEIAASFDNGMEYFSTFGGSTVSCAAGLAVLDVTLGERLQDHAARTGGHLLAQLRALQERHAIVGDVRGSGLFIGVELVTSRTTLAPATPQAGYVVNRLREERILTGSDGPFHNVLKIRPPMPFTVDDADLLVSALDAVLAELPVS